MRRVLSLLLVGLLVASCAEDQPLLPEVSQSSDTVPATVLATTTSVPPITTASTESTSATSAPPSIVQPTVLSVGEIEEIRADAVEFADSYYGSWPSISATLGRMAEDVVFWDPADGDFIIEGKSRVLPAILGFATFLREAEWLVESVFISADGAAYRVSVAENLWPPWLTEPPDHPPVVELDLWWFRDGEITGLDIWFEDATLEMLQFGCFAIEGCPGVGEIVDRYVAAWSTGSEEEIAALYAEDAEFSDSLYAIEAVGPGEIGSLGRARFGPARDTFEIISVFAQTRGPAPATNEQPDLGPVIAVGIHYRISDPDGTAILESLTTFELGSRQPRGFDLHPQGLITREHVFHDLESNDTD